MPAHSEKQRRMFAYLYNLKKSGKKSIKWKKASSKMKKIANSMSSDQLHDFMYKESLNHILSFDEFLGNTE
jgi:hypothetical protein